MLWLVDKYTRSIASARTYRPDAVEYYGRSGSTMVKLTHSDFGNYRPGQFYFVNIPEISINEWHPFTATAMLDDGGLLFFIKVMKKKANSKGNAVNVLSAWTGRLAELAMAEKQWLPVVRIHGPFGHSDFSDYENLLLFAGGIGITPLIAVFADLRARASTGDKSIGKLKNVVLVWMSRFVDEFRMFEEMFGMIISDHIKAKLHVESSAAGVSNSRLSAGVWVGGTARKNDNSIHESVIESGAVGGGNALERRSEIPNVSPSSDATTTLAPQHGPITSSSIAVAETTMTETATDETEIEAGLVKAMEELKRSGDMGTVMDKQANSELQSAVIGDCRFDVNLHCTRRESFLSLTTANSQDYVRMLIKEGRCDLQSMFEANVSPKEGAKTMAAVCGPFSLTKDISTLAWKYGCDFHSEQFYF